MKALKDLLMAFAAAHHKNVTFAQSGFTLELDRAGRWVHEPRSLANTSVSKFYSFRLVNQFVGVKPA